MRKLCPVPPHPPFSQCGTGTRPHVEAQALVQPAPCPACTSKQLSWPPGHIPRTLGRGRVYVDPGNGLGAIWRGYARLLDELPAGSGWSDVRCACPLALWMPCSGMGTAAGGWPGCLVAGAVLALTAPPRDSANSREGTVNWGFPLLYPFWLNMPGVVTAHNRIMQNNNMRVNKMMMS